jgi:hypothetical protein
VTVVEKFMESRGVIESYRQKRNCKQDDNYPIQKRQATFHIFRLYSGVAPAYHARPALLPKNKIGNKPGNNLNL